MKRLNSFWFLAICAILTGCAKITPQTSQAVSFTVISPSLKVSDAGFIHKFKDKSELQIYNSGISVLKLEIFEDKICLNSACDDEVAFNRKFFKNSHYNGFFGDILNHRPIYNAKNLRKTDCGFMQNISENFIQYQFCNNLIEFADSKNKIKIKLKELN